MPQPLPPVVDRAGYLSDQTIVALSSAPGGAIALLRWSGSRAKEILIQLLGEDAKALQVRKPEMVYPKDARGRVLDQAIATIYSAPKSFTGEDCVELSIHGSSEVARSIIDRVCELGARQALPGEFSFRAVRNGKMDIHQAQAVADLISAQNEAAVDLAIEKIQGTQSKFLMTLSEEIRNLVTLSEAGIDFSDQDIDEVSLQKLKETARILAQKLTQLSATYERGKRIQQGIQVAIIGTPNAGKSTFFNLLLGEDRAIVSEIPGTTRDSIRETLFLRGNKGSVQIRIIDTAGLRNTNEPIEAEGILRSKHAVGEADLVLWLLDGERAIQHGEGLVQAKVQLVNAGAFKKDIIGVISKRDLLSPDEQLKSRQAARTLGVDSWFMISSKTGEGLPEAIDAIVESAQRLCARQPKELVLTRLNQVLAINEAVSHLCRADLAPQPELFASDLRQALNALSPVIGETPTDDILGRIFGQFCIGK